jgi:uncharacterized protein YjgD (DUF1641 family)
MSDVDTNSDLNERLDELSAQVGQITEELRLQRESREKWAELNDTMAPITSGAMEMATAELEELSQDVTIEDATRFARTLAINLPQLEKLLEQVEPMSELVAQLSELSGPAMDYLTEFLGAADDKGYFRLGRQATFITDQIVTEFTEEDMHALGENVVIILNAVKEMTQPEVMGLVQRTVHTVQESEDEHVDPPGLFKLLKSMRDPETRRGMARMISMLHTVGEEQPSTSQTPSGRK